ncbi:TOBE domain-containing protein, partial [Streptomyces sp. DSM 41634]|uniref:TOBE domain-containing protein n=1 Tax=Streptomyces sp. DSM 41634 TaxID=3448656 RepID=UPI00403FDCA4
ACTVAARTFRGTHVSLRLDPGRGPRLEAACTVREAPAPGAEGGVIFDPDDVGGRGGCG